MPAMLTGNVPEKRKRRVRLCQNASLSSLTRSISSCEALLAHDHLFDQDLAVDFEAEEINAGCDILSCLGRFSIPVCYVVFGAAGQQQIFQRLSAPRVPNTALQYRHGNELCQKVVYPQTHTVLTSGIHAALLVTHCKRNPGVSGNRVREVLLEPESGALSSPGIRRGALCRRTTWHERAEHEHHQQRSPQVFHDVSKC